jgi:transposase
MVARFDELIRQMLSDTPDLKAPAILERLRPLGYGGGITILRDRVRLYRPRQREAFLTLSFQPGSAVQVDWADFGFALPGCSRRVSAFVMALCYSRYLYLEFALSQSMGSFLRRMENGVRFFGGTTHADIFDNMRTVVSSHTPTGTVFNPRFLDYARTRGFAVKACNLARGNEKGRVERPIGFVRERFWPGRRFKDLMDLNVQAAKWRDDFANNRVHALTGKVPALVFKGQEQKLLKPLNGIPYETDEIEGVGVTKSFRVRFDRNLYSVPPRLVSQSVVIRANDEGVRVFLGPKEVAKHRRCWGVGEDIEDPAHREMALERKPGATGVSLPPRLVALGEVGIHYFQVLAASGRSLNREAVRLTFLVELFGESATCAAVEEVMQSGHVGSEYVEYVLRHRKGLTPAGAPLRLGRPELDELAFREPDLSVYDALFPPAKTLDPGEEETQS